MASASENHISTDHRREPMPRVGSLDGLRAIAVLAVVVYHTDDRLLSGGFVGVDLFFVLSGYLITTLLVAEHHREGSVSLRGFWGRRIRRLWPLAWVTLGVIAVASLGGVWGPDRQRTVPAELLASFAHVANWFQVGHGGYVEQFAAPSPVRHFWSLAVEEQFYLVWPMVMVVGLAATGRRRRASDRALPEVSYSGVDRRRRRQRAPLVRRMVIPAALSVLAAGSIAAGWIQQSDADRSYLGTDVRLVALVIGAALAWAWRNHPLGPSPRLYVRWVALAGGVVGAVVLVVAAATLTPEDRWLARGGFAVLGLAGAGVIAAAVSSRRLSRYLSWRPLVALGRYSFALYLVHWPLLVAIGPGRPLWLRLVVALPVSVVVAATMHRLVEVPVIERSYRPRTLFVNGSVLAAAAVVALLVAQPTEPTPTEQVAASLMQVPDPEPVRATVESPSTAAADTAPPERDAPPDDAATTTTITTTTEAPCEPASANGSITDIDRSTSGFDPDTVRDLPDPSSVACGRRVDLLVVGDSTGKGAANGLANLRFPNLAVWDRTVVGCSLGGESCPDWRSLWTAALDVARPDVVVMYLGVVSDFKGIDEPDFLSAEGDVLRASVLADAIELLSSRGAEVVLVAPPTPIGPQGYFYCDGRARDSGCDPAWVQRWNESVRAAGRTHGVPVLETGQWVAARRGGTADRPDGLHLSGPALIDHAEWMLPQLYDLIT